MSTKGNTCPECGQETWRESADVGVGIIYGPYGCGSCGWSEEKRYDQRDGPKFTDKGHRLDQWGGATPPGGHW